ncbi:MAG: hypothetical protein KAI81_02385, partial [Candidatus Marinimicrobia bacterium]|nr:hypothetical protein [Candidatus Neomarinimicrobiota bacterium]
SRTMGNAIDPGKLYISMGPGISYNSVIGPVRLEFPFVVQDPGNGKGIFEPAEIPFILALLFAF